MNNCFIGLHFIRLFIYTCRIDGTNLTLASVPLRVCHACTRIQAEARQTSERTYADISQLIDVWKICLEVFLPCLCNDIKTGHIVLHVIAALL